MNTKKGRFITLEGGDGVGKTTHISLLEAYLMEHGQSVLTTREPGGTTLGETLRKVLLRDGLECGAETEMMVLFASRTQHLHAVLLPAIAKGQWVLCDRFTDATFAYQGGGRGIPFERIERLETFVQDDFQPDLTLLLDLPVEEGLARAAGRGSLVDRFEEQDLAFKERIRQAYLRRQRDYPDRIQCIDASGSVEEIQIILRQHIQTLLRSDTSRDDVSVA
jgi:dTMP kinase